MDNKVFYGEYSIAYWIELIFTKKILLPSYQRHYVWNEESLSNLVDTFKEQRFVPPITIGAFKSDDGKKCNYIIDGQQRLTSLLLAYLGIFPDKERYKAHVRALANGEEQPMEEGDDDPYDNVLEWTFKFLTDKGRNKAEILAKLEPGNYKSIDLGIDADFLENTFLGFSYIVPLVEGDEQQKFYTKTFREINIQGEKLLAIESRRSLYFLNEKLEKYFEPDFVKNYSIRVVGETQQFDFSRYLCFMAAYYKQNNVNKVARGYGGRKIENYIENYVYSVVDKKYKEIFGDFEDVFPEGDFTEDMKVLNDMLIELDIPKEYPSIINMDIFFFGLIYEVLFRHKKIDVARKYALKQRLQSKIDVMRREEGHAQTPALFKYMRQRITESLNIYGHYSIER